jgi:uridine kinase
MSGEPGAGGVWSEELVGTVARIISAVAPQRRALVAIDGVGASGKTTFAARLAEAVDARPVVVLHVDDFFNPSRIRHAKGRYSSEGFWLDIYNDDALITWALTPLAAGGDGLYRAAAFDPLTDQVVQPPHLYAPRNALVLVEGTFVHRDELAPFWDYSIYLDVPFQETATRMARRFGADPGTEHRLRSRYEGAQRLYFSAAAPWNRASLVIDNTDVENPTIIHPHEASAGRWQPAP